MNTIKVRKRISPFAYVGIFAGVIIIAFASLLISLNMLCLQESYKAAEIKYFRQTADLMNTSTDIKKSYEFEMNFGADMNSELFGMLGAEQVNNTIIKGLMNVDGTDFSFDLSYLNGDKTVLNTTLWLQDNVFSVIFPDISDYMLSFDVSEDETEDFTQELDYDELNKTLEKIVTKYFEMVGEPEIVEKDVTVSAGDLSAICVRYQIDMDTEFLKELVTYSIDCIKENDNLVEFFGGDSFIDELDNAKNDIIDSDVDNYNIIEMDIYACNNNIVKRVINFKSSEDDENVIITVLELENASEGYFSVSLTYNGEDVLLSNKYTKDGDKYSGKITAENNSYSINAELFTLSYEDCGFDEVYGFVGDFELEIPDMMLEISGSADVTDKYNFSFEVEMYDLSVCTYSGYFKELGEYKEIEFPRDGEYIIIDEDELLEYGEKIEGLEDDFEAFIENFDENFADENGNYDVIGYVFSLILTMNNEASLYPDYPIDYSTL